ncbi:MAG: orotidine-5'-phosphate decarboxylase [Dehalococcoidia bacterium]
MTFRQKLERAAHTNGSLLCVGLDPDPDRLPATADKPATAGGVAPFLRAIIEATSDLVCAYKPNLAFYEQLGEAGQIALREVLAAIPEHIPVIGDAKRGDVPHTARAYARALFDQLGFDAVTVNPYLGGDAVEPFIERDDRAALIVCRTSNPAARDLQDLPVGADARPLYEIVAERALGWNTPQSGQARGNVGLVVGATYPEEMRRLRELCPNMLFLVPGLGPQQGELEASLAAGLDANGGGLILNASRTVLYASSGADFAQAARREAESLRAAIEGQRQALRAGAQV